MFRRFTSERVRQQRRKRFVVFSIVYSALALALFLVVWQLSYAPFLRIDTVTIEGEETVVRANVFDVVHTQLTGSYGHLFSKRNVFLYPRTKIQERVLATFPSIKKVSVDVEGVHTLRIRLEERKGVAVACRLQNETREVLAPEECYFVDATGFVFIKAPHFSGSSYVVHELEMAFKPLGMYVFPSEEFTQLTLFATSLGKLSMRVTRIRSSGDVMNITVMTSRRGTVHLLVQRNADYADVLTNLKTIIESEDFRKAAELERIEYIDLRFGNKIFYKEKEGAIEIPVLEDRAPELRPR
jgi:hypothetical protein